MQKGEQIMFNTTTNYSKTVVSNHVNAVTGNITKTYAKSFFKRFHLQSPLADKLFCDSPRMKLDSYKEVSVQVIQMVICGDMEVIAEIIKQSDYDEILK